jgi:hypothetical protein
MKSSWLALIVALLTTLAFGQQNVPLGSTTILNTEKITQALGYTPGPVMTIKGAYASGITYAPGDAVTYNGTVYISLVSSNTENQPDVSSTQWSPLAPGTGFVTVTGNSGITNAVASSSCTTAGCAIQAVQPSTDNPSYFDPAAINPNLGISTTATWLKPINFFDYRNGGVTAFAINTKALNSQFQFPINQPYLFESKQIRRWNTSDTFHGLSVHQTVFSGTTNDVNEGKNQIDGIAVNLDVYSPGQLGGHININGHHTSHGDSVLRAMTYTDVGCSDAGDECQENDRIFHYISPRRFGGTLASVGSPNLSGNVPMQVTVTGSYFANQVGEAMPLINLSRGYSAGNVAGFAPWGVDSVLGIATGDRSANWTAQFGNSVYTTLTAPIDNGSYTGCPSTKNGTLNPDPFIADALGVGGRANYCVTVASTRGLNAGSTPVCIGRMEPTFEQTTIAAIVDSTHLILSTAHSNHLTGEYIFQGGVCGYAIEMQASEIPPGGIQYYPETNTVTLRQTYPLMGTVDGGLVIWTNGARTGSPAEFHSPRALHDTTAQANAVGTAHFTGGSLTSISFSNPGVYQVSGDVHTMAGTQTILPAPTITFTGGTCTTLPVVITTLTSALGVQATIKTPGACSVLPTMKIQTVWQNAYNIYPMAWSYRVISPTTGNAASGYVMTEAIKASNWVPGDLVEMEGWMNQYSTSQQTLGQYYTPVSGSFGHIINDFFRGNWSGRNVFRSITNSTPQTNYYAPGFTNSYPTAYEFAPSGGQRLVGSHQIGLGMTESPYDALLDVDCISIGGEPNQPYCLNGIWWPYKFARFQNSHGTKDIFSYDPTTSILSWEKTLDASTVTSRAVIPAQSTPANSSAACTAGQIWSDAAYIYVCTAKNTIKRTLLSAF